MNVLMAYSSTNYERRQTHTCINIQHCPFFSIFIFITLYRRRIYVACLYFKQKRITTVHLCVVASTVYASIAIHYTNQRICQSQLACLMLPAFFRCVHFILLLSFLYFVWQLSIHLIEWKIGLQALLYILCALIQSRQRLNTAQQR